MTVDKPLLRDLSDPVARAVKLWVKGVEAKEVFGLWLHGPPRSGTTYAAKAALTELASIERYNHQQAFLLSTYIMYQDLHKVWTTSALMRGNSTDAGLIADMFALEDEVSEIWRHEVVVLNDWTETVPTSFWMKHFYPNIRIRIDAQLPTVIATRWTPDETGDERQYFYDEFVIAEVIRDRAER